MLRSSRVVAANSTDPRIPGSAQYVEKEIGWKGLSGEHVAKVHFNGEQNIVAIVPFASPG